MSLREEMWKYEQITGESAEHVPIIKLGAFLDGYEFGLKALEQQPCEDCISREDVMHILDEVGGDFDTPREAVVPIDYIADEVAKLPSVTPTRRKGLDKTEKNCNICGQKCAIKYHGCSNWMPLPSSYQGESEG